MAGSILVGVGGWTFAPWRGVFYPKDLPQKRELEYASRRLTSIEINGTYYSTFKPANWAKWRDETPESFVFAVKGSRYVTNRKELAGAGDSVGVFVNQGLIELGDRLGPINWQLMETKKFEPGDLEDDERREHEREARDREAQDKRSMLVGRVHPHGQSRSRTGPVRHSFE